MFCFKNEMGTSSIDMCHQISSLYSSTNDDIMRNKIIFWIFVAALLLPPGQAFFLPQDEEFKKQYSCFPWIFNPGLFFNISKKDKIEIGVEFR